MNANRRPGVSGRASGSAFSSQRGAAARHENLLGKLATVLVVLRFHLRHELDEFGRLSDAVQKGIMLEQGVTPKTRGGSLS